MKKRIFRIIGVICAAVLFMCGCKGGNTQSSTVDKNSEEYIKALKAARTTPYGKYPEKVVYTLGKLIGTNNSNLPEGDTYENNAYTRFLSEMLNIQNEDVFEEMDKAYESNVNMAIQMGTMPDIMVVNSVDELQLLVEYDMIADLTDAFSYCLTDTIKQMYQSYGDAIIDGVTFDGKIMAIPETNIEDGPNLIWLRTDWMDKLGLSEPRTLKDVEYIVEQFVTRDPGDNGPGQTVGIVCDPSLCGGCGYSSEYLLDIVFASCDAYPKQWIYDGNGNVCYGSVQPEAKAALAKIRDMFEQNILDNNFLLRTTSNIIDLVEGGQCGSFFGPWWAPNNPLMEAIAADPDARWAPFLIATKDDGSTSCYSQNPTYKYVVVRKGFEYPEIACKIVSVLFDYIRYNEGDNDECKKYYQLNVDPTARPLAINVDYNNALMLCFDEIKAALEGEKNPDELLILEKAYYEACKSYLDDPDSATPEEWAAYTSRITACEILKKADINVVQSLFFGHTKTMIESFDELLDMETQIYLKIVTGELSVDAFDDFVAEWYEKGGTQITKEVSEAIQKAGGNDENR